MDYHGPAYGPEPLLHDAGLAIALVAALSIDLAQLGIQRSRRLIALVSLTLIAIAIIAVFPAISPALAGVAAVGLVIAEFLVYRRRLRTPGPALYAGLTALAVGVVIFSLSRTGGPICDPDSWFQGHGVWHVLTALALALWAVTALPDKEA
jgi:predicted membrane channel-forming protein YqfA (hemolysin III family)